MIARALDAGVLVSWMVVGDEVYGSNPHLRAELEHASSATSPPSPAITRVPSDRPELEATWEIRPLLVERVWQLVSSVEDCRSPQPLSSCLIRHPRHLKRSAPMGNLIYIPIAGVVILIGSYLIGKWWNREK
ncbi:hypothetical protein GCM10022284_64590 [Streptomyces hundungensis]